MQDDLLTQLLNASSEEEKAYLLAMALLETQPPEIREAIVAAAVPHWFDAEILAALLTPDPVSVQSGVETPAYTPTPVQGEESSRSDDGMLPEQSGVETPACTPTPFQGENPSRSDDGIQTGVSTPGISTPGTNGFADTYCAIRNLNLPFVQPFGELGLTLHDLTRAGIRGHLFKHEPERFKAYSRHAAAYFSAKDDPQYRIEAIYHVLITDTLQGADRFLDEVKKYNENNLNLSAANMLVANLRELMNSDMLIEGSIKRLLGVGYQMLGDLQMTGDTVSAAADSYQKALIIHEQLTQADPNNTQTQRELSNTYNRLGDIAFRQGNLTEAQAVYQNALSIRATLAQHDKYNLQLQHELAISYNNLGDIYGELGDKFSAYQAYKHYFEICEWLDLQKYPDDSQAEENLLNSHDKFKKFAAYFEPPKTMPLIEQAKQRNEHAFLELLRSYAFIIVSVIRQYLHHIVGYDEGDIHQEIRLRAFEVMPDFHGDEVAFQFWLRRSTRGLCLNILEKQRQHEMIDMETLVKESLIDALPIAELAPDVAYRHQQIRISVEEALAALPEHFRKVLVLKDIDGLRYEEIAVVLNIEIGTVKSRLGRARAILREQLRGVRES